MPVARFRAIARPPGTSHGMPLLVFDEHGRLHLALTLFFQHALWRVARSTASSYLHALLRLFGDLAQQNQQDLVWAWDASPEVVRAGISALFARRMQCKVRPNDAGYTVITASDETTTPVGILLAALRLFYRIMCDIGQYAWEDPMRLVRSAADRSDDEDDAGGELAHLRLMPRLSGVVLPHARERLTDTYFKLRGEDWVPLLIDDPEFPRHIIEAGATFRSGAGWGRRQELVIRILFESGCRIFELCFLMVADWIRRNLGTTIDAPSKASHGVRVKYLQFSEATRTMMLAYFDNERRQADPNHLTLEEYIARAKWDPVRWNLEKVPLFLTSHGTRFQPRTFRECFWNPACARAGIVADVHQARHWYVTQALVAIDEELAERREKGLPIEGFVEQQKADLGDYLHWHRPEEMLRAYSIARRGLGEAGAVHQRILARVDAAHGKAAGLAQTQLVQRVRAADIEALAARTRAAQRAHQALLGREA